MHDECDEIVTVTPGGGCGCLLMAIALALVIWAATGFPRFWDPGHHPRPAAEARW